MPHGTGGTAAARAATTTERTLNWSGEIASGTSFTAVSAEWTVPQVVSSGSARDSASWIGIGGASQAASGLIQTGTDQHVSTGVATYTAWYEVLPALAVTIVDPGTGLPEPVAPGDVMSAKIARQSSGLWLIQTEDVTEGWLSRVASTYTGTTLTAEWIEEAPTLDSTIETLADFGSVRYTHMGDTASGPSTLAGVQMVGRTGVVIAFPGAVQAATTQSVTVYYGSPSTAHGSTTPGSAPPTTGAAGYALVGADGGVFVFDRPGASGGFYGSLPGIGVRPAKPIVGIVAAAGGNGYYLVGSDGGVFAFGDAPFYGSLPGMGVVPRAPITGMVIADGGQGYFLVGRDGGVFSFGSVPFLGSLPAEGVKVDDVVGIASTPGGGGYWLVTSTGRVYAFGAARNFGTVAMGSSPASAIAGTSTGGGYWVTTASGAVYSFGNARPSGTLPSIGVSPALPVVAVVPTAGTNGYWLVARDGGVFAFGAAPFAGALPGIAHVRDIVGAVATAF